MKGHHYVSDTNKFIDLLNKLIINKRTHSRHNNCKTQNTYRGSQHDGKRPLRIPLYSITDWHRSPISDSHPFDQPGT